MPIGYNQLITGTASDGSLYYKPNDNKLLAPIPLGNPGTILSVTNSIPTWVDPSSIGLVGNTGPSGATGPTNPAINLFLFYNY